MIKSTSIFASLFLFLAASILSSCGDDALFSQDDVPTLDQSIFVVPDNFSGLPYLRWNPAKTVYIDTNEFVKFWAIYSLDGQYLPPKESDRYTQSTFWEIEDEIVNLTSFRAAFDSPGHRQIILRSTDYLSDTIVDTLNVFVNTPIAIELISPQNNYNLADPTAKEGVSLSWKVFGIDPWENSHCAVYASTNVDSIWNTPIQENDCLKGGSIKGPIDEKIKKETSKTIYWAVKASNTAKDNFIETSTSPIYQFSTKFVNSDSAIIAIPVVYDALRNLDTVSTQVLLINSVGDTISTLYQKESSTTIKAKVKPQKDLQIVLKERSRSEYHSVSFKMDIPEASLYTTDTVFFQDSVLPQIAPLKERILATDDIKFYALDNGSGIDANRASYIIKTDTLHANYANSIISFKNPCVHSCVIRVSVFDKAKNQSPETFWRIDVKSDSTYIHGPFAREENPYE